MNEKILILEDEARMRRLLELVLAEPGYQVRTAGDGLQGVDLWKSWQPDVVLSDLKMPRLDGMAVLRFRNTYFPQTPLILITAFGTVDTAVAAMKGGAFDYLTKPVDNNMVLELVARAVIASNPAAHGDPPMIGTSAAMQAVRREIAMVARADSSVLVTGESGSGKELVARAIHDAYGDTGAPFVRVNCPAIPQDLLENELFGHRRGAFTGAVEERTGAFVAADGGTLFLDEIGDLPLTLQPKLLHAVENKQVTPVGGTHPQQVRVKIVAATNRDLEAMVGAGAFRQDLFYRLNTLRIHVPPLRRRRDDIEALALHFLREHCARYGRAPLRLDPAALDSLQAYAWPGNVRELRNVVERACLHGAGDLFTQALLPTEITTATATGVPSSDGGTSLDLVARERALIQQALERCYWNQSQAAQALGISRNTLRYRMKKYGITRA